MKANFIRKATKEQLIPQDSFVIEKVIEIDQAIFQCFISYPMDTYDFITENAKLMYCDSDEVFHCIFVTTKDSDFGILVESEGCDYARYAAYLPKAFIGEPK